jgi:hypothetical protein
MSSSSLDWKVMSDHKESKKLNDQLNKLASKLKISLEMSVQDEEKYLAVYSFYRQFYTLTLNKNLREAGVNKHPTRDLVLDYPWKDLNCDRIFCLKIWEKINH